MQFKKLKIGTSNFVHIHDGNREKYEEEVAAYLNLVARETTQWRPDQGIVTSCIGEEDAEYIIYIDEGQEVIAGMRLLPTTGGILSDTYVSPRPFPPSEDIWEVSDVTVEIDSNSNVFDDYAYFDALVSKLYKGLFEKLKNVFCIKNVNLATLITHSEELENIEYYGLWDILMSSILWSDVEGKKEIILSVMDFNREPIDGGMHTLH